MGIGELTSRRAVFLDRDGVLNEAIIREGKPFAPHDLSELRIEPDAADCVRELRNRGFLLIVATNQPDVGRGTQDRARVEEIHAALFASLALDEILVCFHSDADDCGCRKPAPGMLLEASARFGIRLEDSYMIGDRWRDIDAGASAGCHTIWIDRGYLERGPSHAPTARVQTLREATHWILNHAD